MEKRSFFSISVLNFRLLLILLSSQKWQVNKKVKNNAKKRLLPNES
jgi:hypothetical protein